MKKQTIASIGILVFLAIFAASWVFESPILLYIASAIPMIVVPFIPDLPKNQTIRHRRSKHISLVKVRTDEQSPESVVITFKPGAIRWDARSLVLDLEELNDAIPVVQHIPEQKHAAVLTVLQHDLRITGKKNRQVAIYLPNLHDRCQSLSYELESVNRLILRMEDVYMLISPPLTGAASTAVPSSENVRLHA
ncbi:hypothetical protein [Paenibacillus sp. y28]|uniref:hypothetical protein n=1 Tax=Paenibacillus sp. y28 TaxID=3129110 RepID=UPI003015B42A